MKTRIEQPLLLRALLVVTLLVTVLPLPVAAADAGYALSFDGSNDFVVLAPTSSMMAPTWNTTKTVSLWVKPVGAADTCTGPESCDAVFGDRPRYWGVSRGVRNGLDRLWVWNYDGTSDVIGVEYTPDIWVHIALVHSGGVLRAYKNGVEVGSVASGTTRQATSSSVLYLGGIINSTTRNWTFRGVIDEVQLWNVARTPAEIQQDMLSVLAGDEAGLAAYYRMSDGSGLTLTDDSINDWNGTLYDGGSGVPPDGAPPQWIPSDAFPGGNGLPIAGNDAATTDEDVAVTVAVLGNDSDPDSDPLTVTAAGPAANGAVTTDGVTVTYTPNLNFNGADSFPYTISDGRGGTATAQVTVTVLPVNDFPVAVNDAATTNVGVAVSVSVLGNDSDPDSDPLTVIAAGPAANGAVTTDGVTVTYTPNTGFTGADSFPYTISDGKGGTATANVSVTVIAVNHDPVAVNDSAVIEEDMVLVFGVLGNDSDPDNDPLTVIAAGPAAFGAVTTNGVTVTYTPNLNFNGVDSFPYTISDGRGGGATATVTVTVLPVNDPPVAVNDAATTGINVAVSVAVLGNDSDPDGDALTVIAAGPAANGAVTTNGVTVTYTPNTGFTGTDSFPYTVSDGNGGTTIANVSVTVTGSVSAGYALSFDGNNDFVVLAATVSMMAPTWTTTKTVSLWVKPDGPGEICTYSNPEWCDAIFGDRPRWWGIARGIRNGQDKIWVFNFDGNSDTIGVDYTPGEWVHVSLVHSGGILRAYRNGVEVGSIASGPTMQPPAKPVLQIGGVINNASRNWTFSGLIDEVQIWNTARTPAEVQQDMRRFLAGDEPGLAAYYAMSNGSGLVLTDDSINNWNGVLYDGGNGVLPDGTPPLWVESLIFPSSAQ